MSTSTSTSTSTARSRCRPLLFAALLGGCDEPSPVATAATAAASEASSTAVVTSAPPITSALPSASSSVVSEPPPPPKSRRGLWLWEFGKNAPAAPRAAEIAAEMGVGRVFIKGSNGNLGPRWWKNASAENVAEFAKRGIEVWVFGYFYAPDHPDADGRTWGSIKEQSDAMLRVALADGVTGVVVDAEEEFKGDEGAAVALCKTLRGSLKGRPLAYTSYGWLKPNQKFPFKAFDRHCGDAFLPQIYYAFGWPGDVDGSFDRFEKEAAALGLKAPIWPVQSNEKDPSVERMQSFFDRAGPDASIFYMHPEGSPQNAKLSRLRF